METPNGTILWNANFNISAEHPEQMPFNAYSPEASVKVHVALTNEFILVMCVRQVCFKIVETKSGKPSPATVVGYRVIRYIGFLIDPQYGCKNFYAECNINTCPSIYFGMNG